MNIGMVTDTYRPRVNGVVTSTDTFAREYEKMGHKVYIFAPAFPGAEEEPNVIRFPSHYLFFDPEDRLPNTWLPSARRLVKRLPEFKLDILHTQTPFTLGIACPRCGKGELAEKRSRRGKVFYGCSRYPECDYALWDRPLPTPCPQCGAPFLTEKIARQSRSLRCVNPGCGYRSAPEPVGA